LISVINHPLTPIEFKKAWAAMLVKHNVQESVILQKLYDDREMWIGSYFKEIFCGTMTSTQRSESVNSVVKAGYCDNSTAIHEFAKSFLELLEHNKENEAREEYNSQVSKNKKCIAVGKTGYCVGYCFKKVLLKLCNIAGSSNYINVLWVRQAAL
jgi:hypothetical protein